MSHDAHNATVVRLAIVEPQLELQARQLSKFVAGSKISAIVTMHIKAIFSPHFTTHVHAHTRF
jgi:hypothetical protein